MDTELTNPNRTKKAIAGLAVMATLGFGSLATANFASAQGYGGAGTVEQSETADGTTDIELVQLEDGDTEETEDRDGRRGRHGKRGHSFDTAAETLGITVDELRAGIESGQTLAEIAEDNGVSADALVDALVESKTERLAEKVEEGRITQEEADEKLAEKSERIENKVFGIDGDADAGDADA